MYVASKTNILYANVMYATVNENLVRKCDVRK